MWPLFSVPRWGVWRKERLGLAPLPLTCGPPGRADSAAAPEAEGEQSLLPAATPLLYGFGESVAARPGCAQIPVPDTRIASPCNHLLLNMSRRLWRRFWPESIRLMGHWPADPGWEGASDLPSQGLPAATGGATAAAASLPEAVERWFGACGDRRPVCFTLGSLAAIGAPAIPDARRLLETLRAALSLVERQGIVSMGAGTELAAAFAELARAGEGAGTGAATANEHVRAVDTAAGGIDASAWGGVLGVAGSVPHALLFPRCLLFAHFVEA